MYGVATVLGRGDALCCWHCKCKCLVVSASAVLLPGRSSAWIAVLVMFAAVWPGFSLAAWMAPQVASGQRIGRCLKMRRRLPLATSKLQVTHQCVTSKPKLLCGQAYHQASDRPGEAGILGSMSCACWTCVVLDDYAWRCLRDTCAGRRWPVLFWLPSSVWGKCFVQVEWLCCCTGCPAQQASQLLPGSAACSPCSCRPSGHSSCRDLAPQVGWWPMQGAAAFADVATSKEGLPAVPTDNAGGLQ